MMSHQENSMSRHQLEVATWNSELGFFFGSPPGVFWGFGPVSNSFYSINRELSNSKVVFSFFTTQQREKKRNSVYILE